METERITITKSQCIPGGVAATVAGNAIEHWGQWVVDGNKFSDGAIAVFGVFGYNETYDVVTSTRQTKAGWAVKVWLREKGE